MFENIYGWTSVHLSTRRGDFSTTLVVRRWILIAVIGLGPLENMNPLIFWYQPIWVGDTLVILYESLF